MHIEASEGVRTEDWKYIRYINRDGENSEELYHLSEDPLEMFNLIRDPDASAVLDQLRKRYSEYLSLLL